MATHFIGIKGTGMAALACILHDQNIEVNGSDIEKYIFTQDGLVERNIPFTTFDASNIKDGDTVIVGLAFDKNHPEVKAAYENKTCKVYYYNEYLGKLLEDYNSVCVAGCHGKSTTTGLLGTVLAKNDKTAYLIGDGHGYMPKDAKHFVLESCEFQRHFLAYHPDYAIITNIELDHVDYYKDINDYVSAFQSFVDQVKKKVIIYGDDPYLPNLSYKIPYVTYGLKDGNDYQAKNITQGPEGMSFDVYYKGQFLTNVTLSEIGDPFLQDALGTFALAHELGTKVEDIVEGLQEYKGIARRFVIEEVKDSVLIDDYAHHPTAVRYMIDSARKKYPGKKVVALYKPDRFSRLQGFLQGFADALNTADAVCVCDFPKNAKREDETITVTIQDLMDLCPGCKLLDIDEESAAYLQTIAPAVYVFMSSKDIYLLKDMLKKRLEESYMDDQQHLKEQILKSLNGLDEQEEIIIRKRYGLDGENPMTLEEIGEELGMTKESVRQIEEAALRKFKKS